MRSLLAVAIAMLLSGCSAGVTLTKRPPAQPLELRGAFVYPFAFRWEEPAWRSFELSQHLTEVAMNKVDDLLWWGPSEFKVLRAEDDAAWVATTALPQLSRAGGRPDQGVIVRPWAEKRVHTQVRDVQNAKGKASGGGSSEDTTYIGHVEVLHPATRETLFETSGEVEVDAFASTPADAEYDPTPQLTHLMEKLTIAAVKGLGDWAVSTSKPMAVPPLELALTPAVSIRFSDRRASAELEMARMDSVDLDLFRTARAKFLTPSLSDAEVAQVAKLPAGLYVRQSPSDPKWLLEQGDLITAIDEQPALPQTLHRLRFASAPASVKVRQKSGAIIDTVLP